MQMNLTLQLMMTCIYHLNDFHQKQQLSEMVSLIDELSKEADLIEETKQYQLMKTVKMYVKLYRL